MKSEKKYTKPTCMHQYKYALLLTMALAIHKAEHLISRNKKQVDIIS